MDRREEIARIVDPTMWKERARLLERRDEWAARSTPALKLTGVDFVAMYSRDAEDIIAPSLAKADAILALSPPATETGIPDGMVLVPAKVTEAMRLAAWKHVTMALADGQEQALADLWSAMLDAAALTSSAHGAMGEGS
jgi:hypothetical protein